MGEVPIAGSFRQVDWHVLVYLFFLAFHEPNRAT